MCNSRCAFFAAPYNEELYAMDEQTRLNRARKNLLENYNESLVQTLGQNFEHSDRFQEIVRQVAAGRAPQFVLMDCRGL